MQPADPLDARVPRAGSSPTSAARVTAALIAALTLACGGSEAAPIDASSAPDAAGDVRDASVDDAAPDAPAATPILPPQFWEARFDTFAAGFSSATVAIAIDARAESGGVRTVIGANGESTSVWFDVVEPGLLRARTPFEIGTSLFEAACVRPLARVSGAELHFADRDEHEGFETLISLSGEAVFHGRDEEGSPITFSAPATPDETPPRIVTIPERPLPGEPFSLVASEPIDPSFVPYLEAEGRQFAFTSTSPIGAASRWRLDGSAIPPGVYALRARGAARDLAGHAAPLSDRTFELRTLGVVDDPTFETGITGVTAESFRALEGDEEPLDGERSLFVEGRAILVLTVPPGATRLRVSLRAHGNTSGAVVSPHVSLRSTDGTLWQALDAYLPLVLAGTVAGFSAQSGTHDQSFPIDGAPRTLLFEIDPWGPVDAGCRMPVGRDEPLGLTIDGIEAIPTP